MKLILLSAFLFFNYPTKTFLNTNKSFDGKVIKIVDGDTFDVLTNNNSTIRIRMNGIDCPERKQDYYQVCKNALAQFIFGKNVQLVTHGKDRYQRIIADVFYKNENINVAMIQNGFAWHYKKYSSDERMAKAEQNARIKKTGLWKMKDAIAPWDFRKLNKTKKKKASK
ncbi:MAG TPA: thermonuclease family protein [Hanamia sp.]|nr:thermonuclease family protein [Hanamia sp.]